MVSLTQSPEYPPRIFDCRIKELREAHPDKPTIQVLAAAINVTPITMARIELGCDVKLGNAFQLSKIFEKSVEEIWSSKGA